jgi:PAS domain S-box-containing protein
MRGLGRDLPVTNIAAAFYAFAEFLPVGTFLSDLEGRYKYVNPFYCRMLEASSDELLGEGWMKLVPPEDRERVLEELAARHECRHRFRLRSGKTLWVQCRLVPRPDDCGTGYVGTVIDLTQGVQAEAAARQSTQRMEIERERFEANLHDGCIQSLLAVGFALRACAESVEEQPAQSAARVLTQAAKAVTDLAGELRDQFLNEDPAPSASGDLESAVQRILVLHGANVRGVTANIDPAVARSLDANQAMHLVHILREAASNMARHSGATSGRITLSAEGESIRLEVADDGVGFAPDPGRRQGRGLGHIAERAKKLQGSARFVSERGRGTRVIVEIPRAPMAEAAE